MFKPLHLLPHLSLSLSLSLAGRFENRESLAHDLQFLANMPELCDTTFLVGEERQPICGVKPILAARSRYGEMEEGERGRRWKRLKG